MPRLTPEELQEAKRRKAEEERQAREQERQRRREAEEEAARRQQEAEAQRQAAEEARQRALAPLRARYAELQGNADAVGRLCSALDGFYDEIDKLARKNPAVQVTELQLKRANNMICRAKDLLSCDEFIDDVDPFVPAGANPEYRDVVVVLRDLRQGITRRGEEQDRLCRRLAQEDARRQTSEPSAAPHAADGLGIRR